MGNWFQPRTPARAAALALFVALVAPQLALAQRYLVIDVARQMKVGTSESIGYHSQGYSGTLRFEYSTDGSVWKPIDSVTARDGTSQKLAWLIPDDTASSAVIRITSNDSVRALSSPFAIVTRYRPMVEIARTGRVLYTGTKATIGWSLFYADDFEGRIVVELSLDAGATWRPIDSVVSRTPFDSLTWIVPDDTTSRGLIRVRTSDWTSLDTTSAIRIRLQPAIVILAPNGGESLAIESTVTILWETRSIDGHLTLEYSVDSGAYWFTIEARRNAREGLDSLLWLVPAPPTTRGLLRILHEEGTVADTTDSAIRFIAPTSDTPDEERELPLELDLTDVGIIEPAHGQHRPGQRGSCRQIRRSAESASTRRAG